jgi:hypothetical protein
MMVERRPLYLLLCLIWAPLRLRRRYHADPLLTGAAIVVSTHMPNTNEGTVFPFGEKFSTYMIPNYFVLRVHPFLLPSPF